MNLNDLPNVLPAHPVPREQTQALLDRRERPAVPAIAAATERP